MKNNLYKLLSILLVFVLLLSACNGSRQSTHRGINNSNYKGY